MQSAEIATFIANYEQNIADLSRDERIRLRNKIILMQLNTGTTKEQIKQEFRIKDRQLRNIIQDAEAEVEQWYKNLPKKGMLAIFQNNCLDVFDEISRLKNLRNKSDDNLKEFEMTRDIIDSIIKYDRMVAEGPTLISQKETTEQAERIIKEASNGTQQD